jgi:hypothetical protein
MRRRFVRAAIGRLSLLLLPAVTGCASSQDDTDVSTLDLLISKLFGDQECSGSADMTFAPLSLPHAVVQEPYEARICIAGAWTSFASDLPEGLRARPQGDCLFISGVPVRAGRFSFEVGAEGAGTGCDDVSAERDYELVVDVRRRRHRSPDRTP